MYPQVVFEWDHPKNEHLRFRIVEVALSTYVFEQTNKSIRDSMLHFVWAKRTNIDPLALAPVLDKFKTLDLGANAPN